MTSFQSYLTPKHQSSSLKEGLSLLCVTDNDKLPELSHSQTDRLYCSNLISHSYAKQEHLNEHLKLLSLFF